MKLIYILNHYSNSSASHFYHVLHLLELMAQKGVEIALVIEKCEDTPVIENPRIKIYAQKAKSGFYRPVELFKILWTLNRQGFNRIFVRISWVAAIVSGLFGRITGSKVFYWLSGQGKFEAHADLPFGIARIRNYITSILSFSISVALVDYLVTGPEKMIEYFVETGGVKREKLRLLYNDIDLKRFFEPSSEERRLLKIKLGFDPDTKIVFFAHRFSPVRKTTMYVPYVIERFFEEVDGDYLFVLAGSGPEEAEIRHLVEKSGCSSKVRFAGSIPNKSIQDYYRVADIFINPTYAEGFPRVLIEAMACGLPLVTTDAGGISDILGPLQSTYMVSKENPADFSEKLIQLSKSESVRKSLAEENVRTVSRYSTDAVSDMYIRLLGSPK